MAAVLRRRAAPRGRRRPRRARSRGARAPRLPRPVGGPGRGLGIRLEERLPAQAARGHVGRYAAAGEDQRPVGEAEAAVDVVGGHEHGAAAVAKRPKQFLELLGGLAVETGERLVEQQHRRLVEQRASDSEPLRHAPRVGRDFALHEGRETHLLEQQSCRRPRVLDAVEPAVVDEILEPGELRVEIGVVRDDPDAAPEGGRVVAQLHAFDAHAAAERPEQARDQLEQGGLAGAVGTEHGHHRARLHLDGHPAEHAERAEREGEVVNLDGGHVVRSRPTRPRPRPALRAAAGAPTTTRGGCRGS